MALNVKSIDWRSVQALFSPHAADDLNRFLEKMPGNVGQTVLIAAGIAWASAGAIGLFTSMQLQKISEIRESLVEAEALQPVVPLMTEVAVSEDEIKNFVARVSPQYPNLKISNRGNAIEIMSPNVSDFPDFREAIGHVQNGGAMWKVKLDELCAGRECKADKLKVVLKVMKVSIEKPQPPAEETADGAATEAAPEGGG